METLICDASAMTYCFCIPRDMNHQISDNFNNNTFTQCLHTHTLLKISFLGYKPLGYRHSSAVHRRCIAGTFRLYGNQPLIKCKQKRDEKVLGKKCYNRIKGPVIEFDRYRGGSKSSIVPKIPCPIKICKRDFIAPLEYAKIYHLSTFISLQKYPYQLEVSSTARKQPQ